MSFSSHSKVSLVLKNLYRTSLLIAAAAASFTLFNPAAFAATTCPVKPTLLATPAGVKPKMAISNSSMKLKGANLSGAEYDSGNITAAYGCAYIYPGKAEIDYYKSKGFNTIRLPFSGSRLQPVANGALNTTELNRLYSIVNYAAYKGMYVILDVHEYGYRYDSRTKKRLLIGMPGGVPSGDLANFWSRVATAFKAYPNAIFGLMNEPNKQSPQQWRVIAEQSVTAIRKAGAPQLILIPGSYWTGAHSWVSTGNAAAWAGYHGDNNFAFEVHQYLDNNSSGTQMACVKGKGANVLDAASAWARTNRVKLFMGEMGWSWWSTCLPEGQAMTNYMSRSADVWTGWTYWSGGPWVKADYMYMLTPTSLTAPIDRPQMKALQTNL
jgi:endoglucanase